MGNCFGSLFVASNSSSNNINANASSSSAGTFFLFLCLDSVDFRSFHVNLLLILAC